MQGYVIGGKLEEKQLVLLTDFDSSAIPSSWKSQSISIHVRLYFDERKYMKTERFLT
jgi:hypothetical protein